MSSDFAVRVENLSKCYHIYEKPQDRLLQMLSRGRKHYYREFWALNDVSFEIKKGETVGIVGRNGSGKSTLLQMICGTLNPTSGMIQTNGRIAALLELGSGFNPEFTGRENVYLNASVLGLTSREIDERFDQIVAFADIGDFVEQPIKTYSSGMVVRLAFAVIAHVDADILVIDEALAVGDAFFTQKCMRFLRKFMESGTIIFVSHDTGAVVNLCSDAILLNQGRIIRTGTPKEICEYYLVTLCEASQDVTGIKNNSLSNATEENSKIIGSESITTINSLDFTDDAEIITFNPDRREFGTGSAKITNVQLLTPNNKPISWLTGGEDIVLEIKCLASKDILRPIIGFEFKDRLGQVIFAENTFLTYESNPQPVKAGKRFKARFEFHLPNFPTGDYSISPAVSEGSQENHVVHHWIHDALIFRIHSNSASFGLINLPMKTIKLEAESILVKAS